MTEHMISAREIPGVKSNTRPVCEPIPHEGHTCGQPCGVCERPLCCLCDGADATTCRRHDWGAWYDPERDDVISRYVEENKGTVD